MPSIIVRDVSEEDEYFVGTCTHVHESEEIDACAERRLAWLHRTYEAGARTKVALLDGKRVGFLYVMPIEVSPWGPVGRELMVIPCLYVIERAQGRGAGRALIAAAEKEARHQGRKALATTAYYHDFWFMPAPFFEKCDFTVVDRQGNLALMWKVFDSSAKEPRFLEPHYTYRPVPGKVVVDLFYNTFCGTSDIEAQRVREVAAEFGEAVALNEYSADDPATLTRYQIPRRILVNGEEIFWGYEAPREGIREAIERALENV